MTGNCSGRGWMANDVPEAAQQAYQDLYDKTGGMMDDLAGFWRHSAARFANNTGVICYEILNGSQRLRGPGPPPPGRCGPEKSGANECCGS